MPFNGNNQWPLSNRRETIGRTPGSCSSRGRTCSSQDAWSNGRGSMVPDRAPVDTSQISCCALRTRVPAAYRCGPMHVEEWRRSAANRSAAPGTNSLGPMSSANHLSKEWTCHTFRMVMDAKIDHASRRQRHFRMFVACADRVPRSVSPRRPYWGSPPGRRRQMSVKTQSRLSALRKPCGAERDVRAGRPPVGLRNPCAIADPLVEPRAVVLEIRACGGGSAGVR